MFADWLIQLMLVVWNAEVIIHQDHAILLPQGTESSSVQMVFHSLSG